MIRVGIGFDTHRFARGRKLVLGGVAIKYKVGLDGHSDADVLCHAVADALLGAVADGDIGRHFPNTDAAWKDACSIDLLRQVAVRLRGARYRIGNVDATIIAEEPKISPHVMAMRGNLARAMGIAVGCVSVKATTAEKMGALGRKEGMSAMAIAAVQRAER